MHFASLDAGELHFQSECINYGQMHEMAFYEEIYLLLLCSKLFPAKAASLIQLLQWKAMFISPAAPAHNGMHTVYDISEQLCPPVCGLWAIFYQLLLLLW